MSQCSRVLEVLRDGKGHSIGEIHERAGTMRLNSRVADLRKMGFHVIYYRDNGLHTYRLIDGTVPAESSAGPDSGYAHTAGSPQGLPRAASSPSSGDEEISSAGPGTSPERDPSQGQPQKQLSVFEAAA
jgi:hypothetical protein